MAEKLARSMFTKEWLHCMCPLLPVPMPRNQVQGQGVQIHDGPHQTYGSCDARPKGVDLTYTVWDLIIQIEYFF